MRARRMTSLALLLGAMAAAFAPSDVSQGGEPQDTASAVNPHLEGMPPRDLAAYGLFLGDGSSQEPAPGVLPYDVNTPLFSDYAEKYRFVWMPPHTQARYRPGESFDFPVGTILVKTFGYPHDFRHPDQGRRLLETRLLIHKPDGWVGLPYVWSSDQTRATLKVAGATLDDVTWVHTDGSRRTLRYLVPNMNQCKGCHEATGKNRLAPLGPTARNLNRDLAYAHGHRENQLTRWSRAGILAGAPAPDQAPRLAVWNDPATGSLADRARAWLEVNCASCHNPRGAGDTAGLDLRANQDDPRKLGVLKPPVAAGRGTGGRQFGIVPGQPDASILLHRLETTAPGEMMPELGRRVVHHESVALIRAWIKAMDDQ